jgi:hypothetical protein
MARSGRPRRFEEPATKALTIRLTPEQQRDLRQVAAENHTDGSDVKMVTLVYLSDRMMIHEAGCKNKAAAGYAGDVVPENFREAIHSALIGLGTAYLPRVPVGTNPISGSGFAIESTRTVRPLCHGCLTCLPGRHAALQLVEPVEHDIDLSG